MLPSERAACVASLSGFRRHGIESSEVSKHGTRLHAAVHPRVVCRVESASRALRAERGEIIFLHER